MKTARLRATFSCVCINGESDVDAICGHIREQFATGRDDTKLKGEVLAFLDQLVKLDLIRESS